MRLMLVLQKPLDEQEHGKGVCHSNKIFNLHWIGSYSFFKTTSSMWPSFQSNMAFVKIERLTIEGILKHKHAHEKFILLMRSQVELTTLSRLGISKCTLPFHSYFIEVWIRFLTAKECYIIARTKNYLNFDINYSLYSLYKVHNLQDL